MDDNPKVLHDGEVVKKEGDVFVIKIISQAACAKCQAKSLCSAAERKDKYIDTISTENLKPGDSVTVIMEERLGWIAIFYTFILPLLLMASVLFLTSSLGGSEIKSALLALGSLLPYYLLLYVFREKIGKDFIFKAKKKINNN
jgi:positive regulator of sigma E activity